MALDFLIAIIDTRVSSHYFFGNFSTYSLKIIVWV